MIKDFVPILTLLIVGAVYRHFTGVDNARTVRRAIGHIVFTIFLPALAFHVLSTAPLDTMLITIPIVAGVTLVATLGIGFLIVPTMVKLPRPSTGALLLACAWGNVTYLGLPLVTNVYGLHLQRIPLLYDLLALTPLLFSVGVIICLKYGENNLQNTVSDSVRQIITLPPLLAAVTGLVLNASGVVMPEMIVHTLSAAGSVVTPLMVFSVGLALSLPRLTLLRTLTPVIVLKLLVAPLIGYGIGVLMVSDREVLAASTLEAAMPSMVLPMVFAERYGLDQELLAQAILWTTLVSMITLPVIAAW